MNMDKSSPDICVAYLKKFMEEHYDVSGVNVAGVQEITTARFWQLGIKGDNSGMIRRFRGDMNECGLNFQENNHYKLKEFMIPEEDLTLEEARHKAKKMMADGSFLDELDRIYSDRNEKKFYGNPVHYKISASNLEAASRLAMLLAHALRVNHRLEGGRLSRVYDIAETCYDEEDVTHLIETSHGNIVLFDLSGTRDDHGNYASAYREVMDFLSEQILGNHVQTLCIFVDHLNHPGFSASFLGRLAEDLDIIELKEGSGDRETAIEYLKTMAKDSPYELTDGEIEENLPKKDLFNVGELYEIYNKWFSNGLRRKIYRAYQNCAYLEVQQQDRVSLPYEELQKMVGLAEIKQVVDEIIDSARVQKMRSDMGLDTCKTSMHMVFTGNPGSAKTTVARLLEQILTQGEILGGGKFVECGRSDLVGKYVGWTAKAVKAKFREARDGILFIDEAYSLVDDAHSFGDEAINTIVQEMENHRDDVIVIFAGYPDKMEEFLARNEGLRSRIAFHLNFPDYTAPELMEILKLMAAQKGYHLAPGAQKNCLPILEQASRQPEFGNGRYVRNLLEQAMMAQSRRIIKEYKGRKVSRNVISTLKAQDFEVNAAKSLSKEQKRIGFAV